MVYVGIQDVCEKLLFVVVPFSGSKKFCICCSYHLTSEAPTITSSNCIARVDGG